MHRLCNVARLRVRPVAQLSPAVSHRGPTSDGRLRPHRATIAQSASHPASMTVSYLTRVGGLAAAGGSEDEVGRVGDRLDGILTVDQTADGGTRHPLQRLPHDGERGPGVFGFGGAVE